MNGLQTPQDKVNSMLRQGIVVSIVWLMGIGSAIPILQAARAMRITGFSSLVSVTSFQTAKPRCVDPRVEGKLGSMGCLGPVGDSEGRGRTAARRWAKYSVQVTGL